MLCAAMKRGAKQQDLQHCLSVGDVSSVLIYSRTEPGPSEVRFQIHSLPRIHEGLPSLIQDFIMLSCAFGTCCMWTSSLLGVNFFPAQGSTLGKESLVLLHLLLRAAWQLLHCQPSIRCTDDLTEMLCSCRAGVIATSLEDQSVLLKSNNRAGSPLKCSKN